MTAKSKRRARLLRPMERPAIPLSAMAQTHWREADRADFVRAWEAEVAALPEFTDPAYCYRPAAADLEATADNIKRLSSLTVW